ncbi:radiation-inducible immediate-early gene IEX-1 [Megalops cyprinoides]|uniref:radiation-inducible immediate-early gene IEX-1 n=1 Tax=Megalops cyprinoides TaxID=118141 RepID=UPI00186523DB|nr:radiation-inducible immediate-early gene IEX-1 [Megalops cyprinoides]
MLARSNSFVMSISLEHFDYRPMMPRSTEPEIFTFEQVPAELPLRNTPVRHRRKNTRVMYPSNVRKYLPPAEKSPAKRWLLILCLVVFLQIYTEEPCMEAPSTAESPATDIESEDLSFSQYQLLPFHSAEQQAHQMKTFSAESSHPEQSVPQEKSLTEVLNWTCPSRSSERTGLYEQSRRNGYVVALLYPVYHRLGSEK